MRKRSLLLHIMLKQGTSWYALNSKEYLLSPPCLDDSNANLWEVFIHLGHLTPDQIILERRLL